MVDSVHDAPFKGEHLMGNWQEWRRKLDLLFDAQRASGVDLRPYLSKDTLDNHKLQVTLREFYHQSAMAVGVIVRHVPATSLQRIPIDHFTSPVKLLESLEALARPFRFMDLSPELRNTVYDFAKDLHVHEYCSLLRRPRTSSGTDRLQRFPGLTQASSKLRKETRGILFHELTCVLDLEADVCRSRHTGKRLVREMINMIGDELVQVRKFAILGTRFNFWAVLQDSGDIACDFAEPFTLHGDISVSNRLQLRVMQANLNRDAASGQIEIGEFLIDNLDIWIDY